MTKKSTKIKAIKIKVISTNRSKSYFKGRSNLEKRIIKQINND